jgi:hypothetical protein
MALWLADGPLQAPPPCSHRQLIILLEAGRSLARAVPHGHAQGYADVRCTGQTIHRAKVFGCRGCMLETRCVCTSIMAALRLSGARFTYGAIHVLHTSIDRTEDAYITTSFPTVVLQPQYLKQSF